MPEHSGSRPSSWLDTQTRAMLHPEPPDKWAPAVTDRFTLVLLQGGLDRQRFARALDRIWPEPECRTDTLLDAPCPAVIRAGLSLDEVIVGQFELISCDAISVFLRDDVAAQASAQYLSDLFARLRASPEFQLVPVEICFLPDCEAAGRFVDQFVSPVLAKTLRYNCLIQWKDVVFRKKARMMAHWAGQIGIQMAVHG